MQSVKARDTALLSVAKMRWYVLAVLILVVLAVLAQGRSGNRRGSALGEQHRRKSRVNDVKRKRGGRDRSERKARRLERRGNRAREGRVYPVRNRGGTFLSGLFGGRGFLGLNRGSSLFGGQRLFAFIAELIAEAQAA